MSYNLRLRFCFYSDRILVEFQKNIDKLAPSTKVRSLIDNAKLSHNEEELLVFLKQLGDGRPPFIIPKELFCKELFDKIESINFFFTLNYKKSLKRIHTLPFQAKEYDFKLLEATNIKIYIKHFRTNHVEVESYFDFDGIEIPLWYSFLIIRDNLLFKLDTSHIRNKANSIVDDISKHNFSYDEINALNKEFSVLVKSSNHNSKSVSFSQKSSGFLSFDRNLSDEVGFYNHLLEAYLRGKQYVEFDNKIFVFNKKDFDEQTTVQIIQQSNIADSNILEFLEKIKNIKQYDCSNMLTILKTKLKTELKPYQLEGVSWLCNLYKNNAWGGLLADDMGLGKTLQTICFLVANDIHNALIIVPASLVQNWHNEIIKFTNINSSEISLNIAPARFQILSYESARNNITQLGNYEVLILDESQKIKNDNTQIFNAISQIKRNFSIILSGTPIENSLLDLWNMMSAINVNFRWLYDNKIAPFATNAQSAINLSIKFLAPFIKRRQKEQVLHLPKRETKTIFIDFSDDEKIAYKKIYNIFVSALKSGLSARANFVMLEGLLRLRQFCSLHKIIPSTLYQCQHLEDSKLKALLELVHNILYKKQKVLIFSQFTKSLSLLKTALHTTNFLYLDGSTSKANRAKLIESFQAKDSKYDIFLISLKAGGVGLNLTNAQNVIIIEPWFNPAIEEQAFSRIHRIGQNKEVCVYRLLYANSIESKMYNLMQYKLDLVEGLNGGLLKVAKEIFLEEV